jgi:predicted small integral membrane protein
MALAVSFILYIILFSKSTDYNYNCTFVGHVLSLIVFGKMWIKFVMLEVIQIISEGKSYF